MGMRLFLLVLMFCYGVISSSYSGVQKPQYGKSSQTLGYALVGLGVLGTIVAYINSPYYAGSSAISMLLKRICGYSVPSIIPGSQAISGFVTISGLKLLFLPFLEFCRGSIFF